MEVSQVRAVLSMGVSALATLGPLASNSTYDPLDGLGPSFSDFWRECVNDQPVWFGFCWSSAGVLALAALIMSSRHRRDLKAAPITDIRQIYLLYTVLPPVWAFANLFIMLTTPRSSPMSVFMQTQFDVYVLYRFGKLLFQLLVLESAGVHINEEDDEGNAVEHAGERIIVGLAEQGPQKHFATKPCCCCLGPCLESHDLTSFQLLFCFQLLQQCVIVTPIVRMVELWSALVLPEYFDQILKYGNGIATVSQLTALYGLIVLFKSTQLRLSKWRTKKKFLAMQLIKVIQGLQRAIIGSVVGHLSVGSDFCLESGPMTSFWQAWFLVFESFCLAVFLRNAFPAWEVMDTEKRLYSPGNFQIDLMRHLKNKRERSRSRLSSQDICSSTFEIDARALTEEPVFFSGADLSSAASP